MLTSFMICADRTRTGGLSHPSARKRLFTLPPAVWDVPLQFCFIPSLPLQYEGEHGYF